MTSELFESVREDLEAFADDDQDVVVDPSGQCLFVRAGEEISFSLLHRESDVLFVEVDGEQLPYRDFLAHRLGKLNLLAERIAAKRPGVAAYVDTEADLETGGIDREEGSALELLHKECSSQSPFVSQVLFVTADAGQGKTALLKQYQHEQSERFLKGQSGFVFWHVDLQGRQLLRLSEALLGDLGDLRVAGLWMPAIVRLLRHGALVLAIDGFDELAAEQGGSDALGALALLVRQMQDRGTIVAASRRTFFDTDDYISRAGLFSRAGGGDCQFDQLSLKAWNRSKGVQYMTQVEVDGERFQQPEETYDAIVQALGSDDHTIVSRPFLLAQVARALLRFGLVPEEFIRGMEDPYRGVQAVIEAFVDREVTEKWKQRETGEPYLSQEQHLRLLADVAEEMLRSQSATLDIEVIETIATLLLDEWGVEQARSQQVLEMVRMHVLLTPPAGDYRRRAFDHEEFQAWFTAYALKDLLERVGDGDTGVGADLLSASQLSDATAAYVCALLDRQPAKVKAILEGLTGMLEQEWRPTYLQPNIGTLIPHLLDGIADPDGLTVDADVIYSSLVFEGSHLQNVSIRNGTFVNISFARAVWRDVIFDKCSLGEPLLSQDGEYSNVSFRDCQIDGIRVVDAEGGETREYAPTRIAPALARLGISCHLSGGKPEVAVEIPAVEGETRKLVRRVLNVFRRSTLVPESSVEQRFSRDHKKVLEEILPLMVKHDVVKEKKWRGSGKQRAWSLTGSLQDIERADGDPAHPLHGFWRELDRRDG